MWSRETSPPFHAPMVEAGLRDRTLSAPVGEDLEKLARSLRKNLTPDALQTLIVLLSSEQR